MQTTIHILVLVAAAAHKTTIDTVEPIYLPPITNYKVEASGRFMRFIQI